MFRTSSRLIALVLFALPTFSAWAYLPLRYSPLDAYVHNKPGSGPKQVVVVRDGKVQATANLEYNSNGLLAKETYTNASGQTGGTTVYIYDGHRLVQEKTIDAKGKLSALKEFAYSAEGLSLMRVKDGSGNMLVEQRYVLKGGRIVQATQSVGGEEHFRLEYATHGPTLLKVLRDDGKEIGRITFTYKNGKVAERIRKQREQEERCRYEYDGQGRVTSYIYEETNAGKWREVKRVRLVY